MNKESLSKDLLMAHEKNDFVALVSLYSQAANLAKNASDLDAACFYLTHAFIFALEAGLPEAAELNKRLAKHGRAKLLEF